MLDSIFMFLSRFQKPMRGVWKTIPKAYHMYLWASVGVITLFFLLCAQFSGRRRQTLSRREKRALRENRDYVKNYVKGKKVNIYKILSRLSSANYYHKAIYLYLAMFYLTANVVFGIPQAECRRARSLDHRRCNTFSVILLAVE